MAVMENPHPPKASPTLLASASQRSSLAVLWLLACAVLLWLVSLALPGFTVARSPEPWPGARNLGYGLVFGWLCRGWAVYANIFFFVAVLQLFRGKLPIVSTATMVVLAFTLPLFNGVPRDEGTGVILPVESWGLGAGLWLASLLALAVAVAVRAWSPAMVSHGV